MDGLAVEPEGHCIWGKLPIRPALKASIIGNRGGTPVFLIQLALSAVKNPFSSEEIICPSLAFLHLLTLLGKKKNSTSDSHGVAPSFPVPQCATSAATSDLSSHSHEYCNGLFWRVAADIFPSLSPSTSSPPMYEPRLG